MLALLLPHDAQQALRADASALRASAPLKGALGLVFTQALIAFLAMPGMVAFAIPAGWLWLTAHTQLAQPLGLVFLAVGSAALLWCVRDFYVSGKGTLAPWAPPERLVIVGLYRYSRNPMYGSVALVLLGWEIGRASCRERV